jgi:hypothetical protein
MNCVELQRLLPDIMEDDRTAEQTAHLQSCVECSGLVSDLNLISQQARLLQSSDEPSPRVWNSIEIALRAEGLIRPQGQLTLVSSRARRWSRAWLVPVAAALLVAAGVLRYEQGPAQTQTSKVSTATPVATADLQTVANPAMADDDQLLTAVSSSSPARRMRYEADLRDVNAYIRDAEQSARANPNDEAAQAYVMDAYEQKAVVYELAMDRSLP